MGTRAERSGSQVSSSLMLDVTRSMIEKGSDYDKLTACLYITGAAETIQAAFRRFRLQKHPRLVDALTKKKKEIYAKARKHRFKPLSEPVENTAFYAHLIDKISSHQYHEINYNHPDFTRSIFGAVRAKAITLEQMLTIKLMYESLLCFNRGKMPADPASHFKRFEFGEGPYDHKEQISYWKDEHSVALVNKASPENHYYTIDLPYHQAVLYLALKMFDHQISSRLDDDTLNLTKRYIVESRKRNLSPKQHKLIDDLARAINPVANPLMDKNIALSKLISMIKSMDYETYLFIHHQMYTGKDAVLHFKNDDELIKERETIKFMHMLRRVTTQIPMFCFPETSAEVGGGKPPLLSFVLPTIDALNTLQNILHGRESTMPQATVGPESVRQIRGLDEIPANAFGLVSLRDEDALDVSICPGEALLIAHHDVLYYRSKDGGELIRLELDGKIEKPNQLKMLEKGNYTTPNEETRQWVKAYTPHYTTAQKGLITLYPFLTQVDKPSRPVEITHPDIDKTQKPHDLVCYDFLLTWHDVFHAWRNGENFKEVFRRVRHLYDEKGGFVTTNTGMSASIWKLTDLDTSVGVEKRSQKGTASKTTHIIRTLRLFEQFGYNYITQSDNNYLLIHEIINNPSEWNVFLFGIDVLTDFKDITEYELSIVRQERIKAIYNLAHHVKSYLEVNPDASVVEIILYDLLAPLNGDEELIFQRLKDTGFDVLTWSRDGGLFFKGDKQIDANSLRKMSADSIRERLSMGQDSGFTCRI